MIADCPNFSFVPHPIYPWTDQLMVDGLLDEQSIVNGAGDRLRVKVVNPAFAERFAEMRCSEFQAHFRGLMLPIWNQSPIEHVYLNWQTVPDHPEPTIEFEIPLDLRTWCHPWTPVDFIDGLTVAASEPHSERISIRDDMYLKYGVGYIVFPLAAVTHGERIREVVERYVPIAAALLNETTSRLQSQVPERVTLSLSRFPERLSFAIQQYMLYSFQFLCDLGIEANLSVKHAESEVLFSYTPTGKGDSLARMIEALQLYLRFPAESEFPPAGSDTSDIALQELGHAVALVRERGGAIEHHVRIAGRHASNAATHRKDDEESLISGYATVRPLRISLVDIELPEILRRVKRVLGRHGAENDK